MCIVRLCSKANQTSGGDSQILSRYSVGSIKLLEDLLAWAQAQSKDPEEMFFYLLSMVLVLLPTWTLNWTSTWKRIAWRSLAINLLLHTINMCDQLWRLVALLILYLHLFLLLLTLTNRLLHNQFEMERSKTYLSSSDTDLLLTLN